MLRVESVECFFLLPQVFGGLSKALSGPIACPGRCPVNSGTGQNAAQTAAKVAEATLAELEPRIATLLGLAQHGRWPGAQVNRGPSGSRKPGFLETASFWD